MDKPITVFHLDDGKGLRGGQRQMLYLVKELNRAGLQNFVVCRGGSPLDTAAARKGFSSFSLPWLFGVDPVSALMLRGRVKTALAAGRRVILHSHTARAAGVAWLASAGLPALRVVHRRVDFGLSGGLSQKIKYGTAHLVIALSRAIKSILLSHGVPEEKIKIISSTIDLEDTPWKDEEYSQYRLSAKRELGLKFDLPADTVWLGSLIALVPHKDPENLVRSAAEVLKKHPEVHYILAGEGPLESRVRKLVKQLGLESNFHMVGYHSRPYEMLSALDIFVLPSREEGLGSVLIEAMNARAAIVATNAGGITDAITDGVNGLVVPLKDPSALAAAQLRLIEDTALRESMIEGGLKRRLELSSPRMAEQTLEAYERAFKDLNRD